MKVWKKFITENEARKLSKLFCNDFNIEYCDIYYVDMIEGKKISKSKIYSYYIVDPPHILQFSNLLNPIGILVHELTHHLEYTCYDVWGETAFHGYYWNLAKKRVIRWAKKNISNTANWNLPLAAYQTNIKMNDFKL